MLLTFYLTFAGVGPRLSEIMSQGIDFWSRLLDEFLSDLGASDGLRSLIIDGVCAGVGSVLSFIPVIGVLFFCLSVMEETGYLDVLSHLADRPLRHMGIPGEITVSLIMGFGCSVPAILAAGEIKNPRSRELALALIPFMSCSAKLPLYGMITAVFFPQKAGLVTCALYSAGIVIALITAAILKKLMPQEPAAPEKCRLFAGSGAIAKGLRLPSVKKVLSYTWENIKGFFRKAFTVILAASVIIWFLENYGICHGGLAAAESPEESLLAAAGRFAAPVFAPLGFGDWRAAAALITGLSAKEAVVSTLTVLAEGASGIKGLSLPVMLASMFTPLSAFSFLVFCLLYAPCAASVAAMAKTSGSIKHALLTFAFQTALAWLAAFIVYNIGQIFTLLIS